MKIKPIIIALLMFLLGGIIAGTGFGMNARPGLNGSGNMLVTIGIIITLATPLVFMFVGKKAKDK